MSRQTVSAGGRADVAERRHELLGRLGLRANASDQDVESAHNGLVEFLELAPHEVRTWAEARTTDVDEAFALLSGPEDDLIAAGDIEATTPDRPDQTFRAAPPATAPVTPAAPMPAAPLAPSAPAGRRPLRTQTVWGSVIVVVAAIVFGVYYMGRSEVPGIDGTPTNNQATAPPAAPTAVPVDPAKVAALMTKISANPKDIASLQGLGDLYFASTDYKNASLWERKVLAVDPKNQVALLALGAAQFNLGNAAEAKKQWLVAAALYPKNAEVHYDLGFLYMSQTPPDKVNMTAEWNKVVAIDPSSNLAKTVATHLKSATSTPTATATPSAK